MADTKVKLGSLWANEMKNGDTYMSGNFGDAKILIFPNSFKKESKHPDYVIYIASREKKKADAEPAPEPSDYTERGDIPF